MAAILYIDHDEAAQSFIQSILGQKYNIIPASDGPTAIQYCAMIQPDLILMNQALPDMSSDELISRLKMFMPQTPILAISDHREVTGHPMADSQVFTPGVEPDDLITKPIAADELLQRVQTLVPSPVSLSQFTASLLNERDAREYSSVLNRFQTQVAALTQANQRLASLNAISALIGTSLDLEHLTDEILAQIHRNIDFDSATLFLLKGSVLEAAASRGFSGYRRGMYTYHKSERNSAWRAVQHKLPLIINDVTKSPYWEPRPELDKIRSWLGVPLIYKDRVVGVLTLDKNEPNAFTDADARYIFTLAYQIAIAVENAQLFEEWEDQATRLKLINEVSQEINTLLDVDSLFDALAKAIFERLNYDRVAIFEIDETRSLAILKAFHGQHPPQLEIGRYRQALDSGVIEQAVRTGRPILVNDISQEETLPLTEGLGRQSVLVVPLSVGTQVEALIYVVGEDTPGFTDQDLWTLSSLGGQAAIAIKNAWLYRGLDTYSDELERTILARTHRLQAIKKISQVVSQGLDLEELLAVVGHDLGQIFAPETGITVQVTIGLVNGDKLSFRTIHQTEQGRPEGRTPPVDDRTSNGLERAVTVKIERDHLFGQVIAHAKPRMLRNVSRQDISPLAPNGQDQTVNSLLLAPLITAGKTIGLIMVDSRTTDAFDDSDLEMLETLAFQVASAVEHARLLQKTREIAIVEERTRLARDMHDGIAQNLAYLLIQVDRSLNMVDEGSKLEAQLEQIGSLLKQNIDELRRNIFDLRPVELEGKSLFKVIENFVTEFGRRWNLRTTCVIPSKAVNVSPEVESSLYRILQEALANVQQHARCTQLSVKSTVEDERWITLEVTDDGQGFDVEGVQQNFRRTAGKGLGLVSMRERIQSVGGEFKVESVPERGTSIFARLPLNNDSDGGML